MGVKGLFEFLKKRAESSFETVSCDAFAFRQVGVDAYSLIFKYKAAAKDRWLSVFLNQIAIMVFFRMHPIIVLDGKAPKLKEDEQKRRRESRTKIQENVDEIQADLEAYTESGEISDKLREINSKNASPSALLSKKNMIDVDFINAYLKKKREQIIHVSPSDIERLKECMEICGVPVITAPTEAETYCAIQYGLVYSVDSDVLAYGVDIIRNITKNNGCEVVRIAAVLESLEMTHHEFVDFAIICGTDYCTKPLPGIGPVRAYDLIKQYRSIEKLPKNFSTKEVPYQAIREIFLAPPKNTPKRELFCEIVDHDTCSRGLAELGVHDHAKTFSQYTKVVFEA